MNVYYLFSISLIELSEYAFNNNLELASAKKSFDLAVLEYDNLKYQYSPNLYFSTNTTGVNRNYLINNSVSINYSQNLPTGTMIGLTFDSSIYSTHNTYYLDNINLIFSLSQRLFSFSSKNNWSNMTENISNQTMNYQYYQFLYVKKNIIQELIRNYFYGYINKNDIEICNNKICLLDDRIYLLEHEKKLGQANQAQINEIYSSKLDLQLNLISLSSSYTNYIQNIKKICGFDFDESTIFDSNKVDAKSVIDFYSSDFDNMSKLLEYTYQVECEIIKSNFQLEKQSLAPVIEFILQPTWFFENNSLKRDSNTWTSTLKLNMSSFLSQKQKKYEDEYNLNLQNLKNKYNILISEQNLLQHQYESLLQQYKLQLENINLLIYEKETEVYDLEIEYKKGLISEYDTYVAKMYLRNLELTKKNIELYIQLYEIFIGLNL